MSLIKYLVLPNCYINTPFASIMMEGRHQEKDEEDVRGGMMDRIWMEGEDVYTK